MSQGYAVFLEEWKEDGRVTFEFDDKTNLLKAKQKHDRGQYTVSTFESKVTGRTYRWEKA